MEGLLCNTNSAGIQSEPVNQSIDKQVVLETKAVSPKHVVTDKYLETQHEKYAVNGHAENDSETLTNGESLDSYAVSQKTVAPTLIGSAIQAVKNLFSPDKTKGKSVSVLSPVNQQINAESQHICIQGKAEPSSEPTIEILNNIQLASEENKKNFQTLEGGGTQSPLTLEPLSSMDETFFTTVSLIDESFHSTVTDLDEYEALKNGINFIGNVLNNSQQTELVNPCNTTLESDESHLENTTLKVGSFTSDENEICNASVLNGDGNAEKFGGFFSDNVIPSGSEKVGDETEGNMPNGQIQSEESKKSLEEKSVPHPTAVSSNATVTVRKVNGYEGVSDIFLNKTFEDYVPPQENDTNINFVGSNGEPVFVHGSISTTTVVLNSNNSDTLTSLKTDDLDSCTSSFTCFESDSVTSSMENMMRKSLHEPHRELPYEQYTDNFSCPGTSFSLPSKEKKSVSEGNSPNNTLNSNKIKLNKSDELITHRSLCEPLEGKWTHQEKNSSIDITLIKNIEASEIADESNTFGKVTHAYEERHSEAGENEFALGPNSVPVISQQSYTILTQDNRLNRPVIEPVSSFVEPSEKQTFQMTQLDGTLTTIRETSFGKNCKNISFSTDDDSVNSPGPKQSTPLWEGSTQNGLKILRPNALKLHSPDNKKHVFCDAKEMKKNISIHTHSAEISPVDPINDHAFSIENEAEENCKSGKSNRPSLESNKSFDSKTKSDISSRSQEKSPVTTKMNQTFDKKQQQQSDKNQECHKPNETTQRKSLSPKVSRKESHSPVRQSDTVAHGKLNATFSKNSTSKSKNLNSTFTKKGESEENEKENQTFNISSPHEASQLNRTYDKAIGGNQLNETFDKDKDSFLSKTQVIDGVSDSSAFNQTFTTENIVEGICRGKEMQELNVTFDKNKMGEIREELEADDGNASTEGSRTFRKPSSHLPLAMETETLSVSDDLPCNNLYNNNKTSEESTRCESFKSANSSTSDVSTVMLNEKELGENQSIDDLSEKLGKMDLDPMSEVNGVAEFSEFSECISEDLQNMQTEEKLLNSLKDDKLRCDPDLVQLIQEQFSPNDIEKICNVVQDLSPLKLSQDILRASEKFDSSFHANLSAVEFKPAETVLKPDKDMNPLSPHSLDFLNSIGGKPTGRDLSRESLYVKFDPLVQPSSNSLIDFTKEGEALPAISASPPSPHSTSICEQLLAISPEKKPDDIVPPLTPLSHKVKADLNEEKLEKLKELQNEIYFLKNLYAERERTNKVKLEDYESQIAKLTGESCFLTDKLKESTEREKSLVKKLKEQNQGISQLKIIMEEYVKVISKLAAELETLKNESTKQVEALTQERDSYMTHLHNTEAAFTDVHMKYEKGKKTIISLKSNESMYRNTIENHAKKFDDFKEKAREAQEKALVEFQKIQEELNETKADHAQETARLRAQLRKTELKMEALQESLDQKIKENQKLTAICDELIEGKK